MSAATRHCCVMNAGDFGILIEGPSGSGKTSLMFGLQERLSQMAIATQLVSDDYAHLAADAGEIIATAPRDIRDMAEVRGYGVVAIDAAAKSAPIGLVVQLVADEQVDRMPENETIDLLNHTVSLIKVPERHEAGAIRIILSWLRDNSPLALPTVGS